MILMIFYFFDIFWICGTKLKLPFQGSLVRYLGSGNQLARSGGTNRGPPHGNFIFVPQIQKSIKNPQIICFDDFGMFLGCFCLDVSSVKTEDLRNMFYPSSSFLSPSYSNISLISFHINIQIL